MPDRNLTNDMDWNYDYDRRDYDDPNYHPDRDRGYYDPNYYPRDNDDVSNGPYVGYGPSGYARPADRIKDDINDRLTWHSHLDATDINVDVNDGVVTLTGSVDSRRDKRLAEDIADSVSGVQDVNNQLRVRNLHRGHREPDVHTWDEIRTGMEVLGNDGERVGQVKDVRDRDFLAERPNARDIYIPFDACHTDNGRVYLNDVSSRDVDAQGWPAADKVRNK